MEELQMPGGNGYATAAIPEIPHVVVMDMPNPTFGVVRAIRSGLPMMIHIQ